MIRLFSYPGTRGLRVTWMLEELGLDYEYHLVPFGERGFSSDEFLKISPSGKVPALEDDNGVLTESAAIVTYLGDQHPQKKLIPPPGGIARGRHDQWCYFAMTELEQPLWTKGKHTFALPENKRVPDVIETAAWEFQKALKALAQGLNGNAFILGDSFTAADVLIGYTLSWARKARQPIEIDNVKDYAERVLGREALARAREKEESSRDK